MKKRWIVAGVLVLLAGGVYIGNRSGDGGDAPPRLLAHRGIAQTFPMDGVQADTCTATRIHPPDHTYIENTLPSMRAAFAAGADSLEFDVQVSADGELVVFHDSTLECRTDGRGTVKEHTLAELRRLDLGYGYTADNGATFPLRGKGTGLLVTVPEVVAAFPDRELLLDLKNDDAADGERVAAFLDTLPAERLTTISVYGGDASVAAVGDRVRGASKATMKNCLLAYEGLGWTGYVPDACRNTELHLPHQYGRFLWGWPNRFEERMRAVDTRVVLVAGDGDWSEGFDDAEAMADVPKGWSGWLWTNRVDRIHRPG
ncbi:glycerophosphodiester phosphodiesterase family protein [Actinoplanes couchii]|uniref:Glycerophosphoryl diester phosphodiesterase n=1 Tax=Actinoplanes couchii TaxID=403638 RepID=A0ABQ3XN84_9ACTN|nr:glycerophosphodiester phosphodiesterase family protein [Actinoplanes couchii]MDR6317863.1 glycerophosphoryl diester phosphodiesterase [Actinoplanes couchii]GID59850.1 glycerophosphoryl diester phosphodiesterase [Actinoplanes couchii]